MKNKKNEESGINRRNFLKISSRLRGGRYPFQSPGHFGGDQIPKNSQRTL